MSILINLLPDIRQQKQKEAHRRQLATGLSLLVWGICGGVLVVLTLIMLGQKGAIKLTSDSINKKKSQLEGISGLTDALTAQQHLASLPGLYSNRVYITKFFKAYSESNPTEITIGSMALSEDNLLQVSGVGKSYASVAKLARALEASNVKVGSNAAAGNQPYFTDVTITSVSQSNAGSTSFALKATVASEVSDAN